MTLLEATYELQSPLTNDQLALLAVFANTYGLRRFRADDSRKLLTFEYDASRLLESQVIRVLGQAGVAISGKVSQTGTAEWIPLAPAKLPSASAA